jgi:hypothetical protein
MANRESLSRASGRRRPSLDENFPDAEAGLYVLLSFGAVFCLAEPGR